MSINRNPFRLGVSGSCFIFTMPEELIVAAYRSALQGTLEKFDDRQNAMMVDFMRDMMRVMNGMDEISAMECYHSTAWDNELILDVALDNPRVEFWSVHAPYGLYIDPSSPDEMAREGAVMSYCDAITTAKRLGAGVVVCHPGINRRPDVPKDVKLRNTIDPFKRVADFAGENGVKIAVEPLPKQEAGSTLEEVLWIIEQVDRPNVGVNFDVNHLFPPEAIPGMIRKTGELLLSVHISDQDGIERHWLPFQGTLDWKEILAALTEIGYTGPLMYETHIHDVSTCEEVGKPIVENYKQLIELAPGK